MKAKELMIGDWVYIDEPDKYAGATGQIQSLMYHREGDAAYFHVFIQGKFGYVSRDVCSDDIRPIPLTAEILEKNGFYYDEDRKAYLMGVIFRVKPEGYGLFSFEICGCPYPLNTVHELQHALRLCEIEKEIIL